MNNVANSLSAFFTFPTLNSGGLPVDSIAFVEQTRIFSTIRTFIRVATTISLRFENIDFINKVSKTKNKSRKSTLIKQSKNEILHKSSPYGDVSKREKTSQQF